MEKFFSMISVGDQAAVKTAFATVALVLAFVLANWLLNWWSGKKKTSFRENLEVLGLIITGLIVFLFVALPEVALDQIVDFFKGKNRKLLDQAHTELNWCEHKVHVMSREDYFILVRRVNNVYERVTLLTEPETWKTLSKKEQKIHDQIHIRGEDILNRAYRCAHAPVQIQPDTVGSDSLIPQPVGA